MSLHAQSNQRLEVDDRVETADNQRGTVKYIGEVPPLGPGFWVGVDLDDPVENGNDGTINGECYFNGRAKHGTFIPYESAQPLSDSMLPQTYNNYYNDPSNAPNIEFEQKKNRLSRKIDRRPSMREIENRGIVPPNYFRDPKAAERRRTLTHELAAFALQDFLPDRPAQQDIENAGVVPKEYFKDPEATQRSKKLKREMVEHELTDFVGKRPTPDQMAKTNIIPKEYRENDDVREAKKQRQSHRRELSQSLDRKIGRRPTITDLGEMHIIPHDYLDRLVQEATIHHKRDPSRLEHMKGRLEKHLPQPVAEALAGSLLSNLNEKEKDKIPDNQNDNNNNNNNNNNEQSSYLTHTKIEEESEEYSDTNNDNENYENDNNENRQNKAIPVDDGSSDIEDAHGNYNNKEETPNDSTKPTVKYDAKARSPSDNFVPLNPLEKERVKSSLTRRLSRRASQDQIEIWGYVPPDYFDNPQKSVMAQTIGREMALDVLESFYPKRPDLSELTNKGVIHPDYIKKDVDEARQAEKRRRQSLKADLNEKLNPKKRLSVVQLAEAGYIPESWLLDLYGLADVVRKKHQRMESAVADLEKQLNVPSVLAEAVATDILQEIEGVDPYITSKNKGANNENTERKNNVENGSKSRAETDLRVGGGSNNKNKNENKRGSIDLQPHVDVDALREAMEKEISQRLKAEYESYVAQTLNDMQAKSQEYIQSLEARHKSENSQLINKIAELSNEIEGEREKYNELSNDLRMTQAQNEKLSNENSALNRNVESIKTFEKQYMQRIQELEDELNSKTQLETKIREMEMTMNDLRNDKKKLSINCAEEMNKLRNYIIALEKRNSSNSNMSSSWTFGLFG